MPWQPLHEKHYFRWEVPDFALIMPNLIELLLFRWINIIIPQYRVNNNKDSSVISSFHVWSFNNWFVHNTKFGSDMWVGGESRVRVYGVLQAVLCSSFSKSLRVFTRWEGVKVSVDPERHKMLYDQSVCSSLQWKERTFSFSSVAHC